MRGTCLLLVLLSGVVLGLAGFGWYQYRHLSSGLLRSDALGGVPHSPHGDTTILVIGLDSRLDQQGRPLPAGIYDALHAGDEQSGGYNANVLMLVHIPAGGGRATSISIPRDDYVDFPGRPDGVPRGKIKQAYGFAVEQQRRQLIAQGLTDPVAIEQKSRDAGRAEQIATVRQLLGGVPVDHFVEVTMVAFYQLARVVAPITVCVNQPTRDAYSGADFRAGYQQIDAEQAVAFVRQRRDPQRPEFTDLDRERRQQAFIASLAHQLKQARTFTNPSRLAALVDVAKQNIAVDDDLDPRALAGQAADLADGDVTFVTLPIVGFGTDALGQDVNIVDVPAVQDLTRRLLSPALPPPRAPAPAHSGNAAEDSSDGTSDGTSASSALPEPAAGTGSPQHPPIAGGAVPCVN